MDGDFARESDTLWPKYVGLRSQGGQTLQRGLVLLILALIVLFITGKHLFISSATACQTAWIVPPSLIFAPNEPGPMRMQAQNTYQLPNVLFEPLKTLLFWGHVYRTFLQAETGSHAHYSQGRRQQTRYNKIILMYATFDVIDFRPVVYKERKKSRDTKVGPTPPGAGSNFGGSWLLSGLSYYHLWTSQHRAPHFPTLPELVWIIKMLIPVVRSTFYAQNVFPKSPDGDLWTCP